MAYKSKFMQEMEQQGKLSAASGTSKYKSKFFQEGGHLEKEVLPAPMRTATDRTFAGVKTTPAATKPVAERPTEQQNQISGEIAARTAGAGSRDPIGTAAHMTKISGLQVQEAELKLNQSKAKLDAARQKEMTLTEQSKKLASAQQGLRQLMTQYEMSGDDVTGQAYLLAAEEYNKLLEQYQKDYAAYEKDASVYDEYNSNLLKYQKAYAGYEKNMQTYNTERADYLQEHPEIALQDASDREIQRTLDRLESEKSGLILTGKAVDWDAVENVNRKIDAVKQLQQQKRLGADNGLWNSGAGSFLDRMQAAIQAGQTDWMAGAAQIDRKVGNAALHVVGSQLHSMAIATGNDALLQTSNRILEQSKTESADAAAAMKASQDYMAEALTGAGKIDGWIIEKMQSVGSMMMDMMAAGSTYAMGIPAGADAGKIMAIRAGGSGMLQAQQEGKSETEQLLMGVATGALEYASERMFGGNPIYDAESGWVTDAVAKVIKNPKILKLMYSDGFGIFSEGLEETFVSFMEPVAEGIITLEKPEMATAAELADAFAGGVFLSLVGQGSSVVVREVSGVGRAERQAGRVIQRSDAVQELVSEGLAAKPNTEAFKLATELQEKLDAGKKLSAAEIGRQLFANQDAIDAGLLVDDEMQPDSEAPEGAMQDPESGYYAIQTAEADEKQTYQLVEVREDGSIRKIGQPADDLMAAKRAAQAQGLNVRHIGKEDVLRGVAQSTMDQVKATDTESAAAVNAADNENTGLRWAGNEEGAYDYGTEQRNMGTGADQERIGGNETGRPAESQNGGWAGDTVRRAEEARRIRAYAETAGLERRSLKELGFAQGSDGKNLRVLNRGAGQDVAEAYDMAQNAGLRLVPVSGNMYVQMGADESRVNGIIENGVIYAQADSTAMSIKEVVSHEIFHDRVKKEPGLVRRLVRYMFDNYSQQEISRQFQKYYDDYQEIYSGTASDEDLNEMIWEEFLADAYAEYSRYGDAALEGLSEEVQEQAWAGKNSERKNGGDGRYSFAGRSAETADQDQKRRAEEMEKQGMTAAEIYEETGWYRGKDRKWRFELDDSQMEYSRRGDLEFRKEHPSYGRYRDLLAKAEDYMIGKSNEWLTMEEQAELTDLQRVWTGTFKKDGRVREDARPKTKLTDYIKHDALFEAYPQLRDTSLVFEEMERGDRGRYNRSSDTIFVNENLRHAPEDVLIHELQHAIQQIEGFAGGSSVEYWDMRKREGLDIRENDRRIAEADREYQRLFRSAPEELQDKIRAINRAKLRDDWDTVLEIEDQIYGTEYEELYVRLGDTDFDRRMERGDEVSSVDLYRNTAGEIEARNAAERRKLTKEQRREMFPELGDENTVFAGKNNNAAQELSRGVTENGSLAETTSAASETIIDRDGEGVNTRFSVSSEDRARQKAERDLARSIGEIMSLPRKAVQQLQTGLVREIMEEYQLTGELNTEKLQEAAANAFAQGLIIDNEYYEQYKHIRDQLRSTAVTISQQDQADIADYNQFRKRAFGTLRIVKQGGIPVDSLYQELMETTPELFPRTITHPADQLVHMYEVAREIRRVETPLERAMGEQSDQFYEWAEGKIAQTVERILIRYADSVQWKPKPEESRARLTDDTSDTYDRANERMYDYGQQSYNELPEPGSGVVQEDYIQPEEGGVVWAGQSRVGNWRQEVPEYEAYTYDPRTQERMERFGQEIIDDYEPMPEEPEVLTEEEQARRGTMREWIQYVLSDKLTPERFAERMRSSAVGELKGGAAKLVGRMEETARQRQGDGVNLYRDPDMTDEQYEDLNAAWKNRQERKTEKLETAEQIIIPKEAFRSTPAMDKLGIKIDGSVTRYRETAQLRAYDEAAEKAQKMLNRRIRKLKASAEEVDLAKMLVKGTITPAMLDREALNLNTITELADYLGAVESFNDDRINQRRAEINTNNLKVAKELLQDSEAYHPQLPGVLAGMTKLIMNERTPERVVKQIFGAEQGGKIYETYFRPVWVNGAEMHRFENRMLKRVAEFKDRDGRTRKLTEKEREFAQRLMEGEAAKESVMSLDQDLRERVISVAQNTNNGADFDDQTKEFGIDGEENERYRGLAQAYADYLDTVTLSEDMDQTILWNAIRTYQQIYNEMYEAMNDFLVSHGYKPMGFIKGYAPHFQKREVQQGLFGALKALGVEKESVTELPASIAGRTADFKPNMKWNPHMQSRQGTDTSYDIQMGFEQYLHYAAEMFYHTDDVMRIRQAVNWMRGQYSGEEISDAIKDAEVDQFKSVEWKRDFLLKKEFIKPQDDLDARAIQQAYQEYVTGLFERVKPENLRKYSEFVTWLDNYANIVAGKQSLADRGLEYGGGRNALNMGSKMMRRFASANVAGNISSVLNQSAQLPLLQQQLGTYLERAVFDLARGGARKENFAERSDFLTDKRGVDKLTTDNMEKFISGLFKPAEMMDRLVSTLAVRGRYLQALDQGMTPDEALKAADDFGRQVMGSRMKGARPLGFESKTFVNQMLHIFQTEASNTFDYMLLSDIPQAVKEVRKTKGKAAAARYTAGAIVGYLIGAFLLNSLTDELYGGSPAPFDLMGWLLNFVAGGWGRDDEEFMKTVIDNVWERAYGERPFETEQLDREEGFRWAGAADDLTYNVLGDVPYVRNALGVMGLGDQSMPTVGINDFAESVKSAGKTLWDQVIKGEEETGLDWAGAAAKIGEDLLDAATLVMPGGRQIQKSYQGIKGVAMGGKVSGFGENARLQYPIEQNAWNAIRAGLFGLTALDETDAFYAGGQALTAGQTQKVRELEGKGIDQNITYELYQEFRQINKDLEGSEASEAKRNAINNLPLEDQQKLTVFDTFVLDKSSKNYEKTLSEYQAMLDAGLRWSEVTDAHNTYAMIDADEEMRGTEKATEFAKWVDMQGWNDEQRGAVEARFRYWNMMPAAATNYTKFEAAGLDPEQAAAATELLAALTPEEGKETVSVNQKVMELQKSKLPAEEKMDAIAALVPDRQARFVEAGVSDGTAKTLAAEIAIAEAENGDDEVTYLEKARIAVDRTPNDEEALAAMSVVLNDNTYAKVEVIREYGVRCENWVSFREEWLDRYGDDSMSQEKVETVLDRMNLNNRQKAALWQISNKSWKPDNNPYDAYVAEMVWDALN